MQSERTGSWGSLAANARQSVLRYDLSRVMDKVLEAYGAIRVPAGAMKDIG